MRNLKVIGRSLLDVYESMFTLLLVNLVWMLLAVVPVSYMLTLLQAAGDSTEALSGVPVLLTVLLLLLALLTSPASYSLAVLMRRVTEYEAISVRDFLVGMRQHWRRAWQMGLVSVVGTVLLLVNLSFYTNTGGWAAALVPLFIFLTLIWLLVLLYLFPMAVITDGGPLRVVRNCLIVIMRHPGLSLLAGIVSALLIGLSTALVVPWLIVTMAALTAIGTRAIRSAVRRDFGQPDEEPLSDEPLPPIQGIDEATPLPYYGWRSARRTADDEQAVDAAPDGGPADEVRAPASTPAPAAAEGERPAERGS